MPATSKMEHFVTIANASPKTITNSAKKEKEHCSRQIPTNKYSKNTSWMFFSFKGKCVLLILFLVVFSKFVDGCWLCKLYT